MNFIETDADPGLTWSGLTYLLTYFNYAPLNTELYWQQASKLKKEPMTPSNPTFIPPTGNSVLIKSQN